MAASVKYRGTCNDKGEIAEENAHFDAINERPVDGISIDFLYKPHTVTLLTVSVVGLLVIAVVR